MVALADLPGDVLSCVFDYMTVMQLVVMSHVSKRLRLCAHAHETFWSVASLDFNLQPAALEIFMTQLLQSQIGRRPISVTVMPQKGWSNYPDQLPFMRNTIVPAIGASLSHLVALHVEVPSTLSECMVNALRQPAPALRSFTVTNWRHLQASTGFPRIADWQPLTDATVIPSDIFAMYSPQLVKLYIGNGVAFPDALLLAFQAVEQVTFHVGCNLPNQSGLARLFEWFPNLLHLDFRMVEVATETWIRSPPELLRRLSALVSIGLHASSLANLQQLGLSTQFLTPIRHVRLMTHSKGPAPSSSPSTHGVNNALAQHLIPPSSAEMSCWLKYMPRLSESSVAFDGDSAIAFLSEGIPPISRETDTSLLHPEHGGVCVWRSFTAIASLTALSTDVELWQSFRQYTSALPSLKVMLITVKSQLPRQPDAAGQMEVVSCPRLNTVIFQSRPGYAGAERAIVTCRGIDAFLSASLSVDDWPSVEVTLLDVSLYGSGTTAGTRISRVSESSRRECAKRSPRIATLLRFSQS